MTINKQLFPGLLSCVLVAVAAKFLAVNYDIPVMLLALLLGMTMNFLADDEKCKVGIDFTTRSILRFGVALLGLRITFDQIESLSWQPVLMVVMMVALVISVSMLAAKILGFQSIFGLLTGGATAICGASAAMALAAAMPNHPMKERALLFTVIGVSVLSTLAMIIYPLVAYWLGLNEHQAGIFLGATIHDVAQVVGAGYLMSTNTGDTATIVKLIRVAMLVPVIVFTAFVTRQHAENEGTSERPQFLPLFAVVFFILAAFNSMAWVPEFVVHAGDTVSRWCLLSAIVGLGMKTRIKELATVGVKPVLLMLGETLFLALMVLLCIPYLD